MEQYGSSLLRMCALYLKDADLAQDAVQETFIKAYKALPNYRGESSVKTWLMRIAINSCRDAQRTGWWKHISRRVSLDMLPELSGDLSEDALTVNLEIARLPGKLREVILLYYYSNMQITEIAEALELAPSHIRVNCVAPGVIDTDMVQVLGQETLDALAEQTPLGRLGTPEDIAHAVAFFASDKASFLTGQVLTADGGFIV